MFFRRRTLESMGQASEKSVSIDDMQRRGSARRDESNSWTPVDSPRPCVHARHFESIVPSAGVSSLVFGARAHPVSVSFAVLPTAAECAAVLEVKATATDLCSLLNAAGLLRLRWQRLLHCEFEFLVDSHWIARLFGFDKTKKTFFFPFDCRLDRVSERLSLSWSHHFG